MTDAERAREVAKKWIGPEPDAFAGGTWASGTFPTTITIKPHSEYVADLAKQIESAVRQARLEEAKWWRNYFPEDATQYDVRIAALEGPNEAH